MREASHRGERRLRKGGEQVLLDLLNFKRIVGCTVVFEISTFIISCLKQRSILHCYISICSEQVNICYSNLHILESESKTRYKLQLIRHKNESPLERKKIKLVARTSRSINIVSELPGSSAKQYWQRHDYAIIYQEFTISPSSLYNC